MSEPHHVHQTGLCHLKSARSLCSSLNQQVVTQVCFTFPHKHNQYLLLVTNFNRVKQPASTVVLVFEKCGNVLGWLQMCSFILITWACWLLNIKGLSGAVKRAYCYIPAPTAATSQGFPFYNNSQLILLNSQTYLLMRDKTFCLQFLQTQIADKC